MTTPIPNNVYSSQSGTTSTKSFITVLFPRAPTQSDGVAQGYQIGQRWIDTSDGNAEFFLLSFIASNGLILANWVQLASGSAGNETITGNFGPPVVPLAGNINVVGDIASGISTTGAANTLTATLAAIPNSSLLNSEIGLVAGPGISITSSPVPLGDFTTISATNLGTVQTLEGNTGGPVPPNGSGNINVVGDGVTVNVAGDSVTNTLTITAISSSTGFSRINRQVFTTSGLYTPTPNMEFVDIEVVGGGGGGAGVPAAPGGGAAAAGGGGGGGYARGIFTAATIGVSQPITIGAGGAGGPANQSDGGPGATSSVGILITASGGSGGVRSSANDQFASIAEGASGGIGGGGDIQVRGGSGGGGCAIFVTTFGGITLSGGGGASYFGGGAPARAATAGGAGNGNGATGYGGGGGAAISVDNTSGGVGGNGMSGVVVITEYIT